MKKKLTAVLLTVLLVFGISACAPKGLDAVSENLSSYAITAVYDDTAKTLSAHMDLKYVNQSQAKLDNIMFHLYPAAYREGARFKPVAARDEAQAYPEGTSYGGIEVSNLKVGGKDAAITIAGQDEDILDVPLFSPLAPTQSVKISLDFKVKLAHVRHRLGWFNKTVNLGNFYPIACVYEKDGFAADPYYSNGDPFYSDLANYKVSLSFPKEFKAAVTGNCSEKETEDEVTVTASAKAVRDFAAVLGKFDKKSATVSGITVDYYYYSDQTPDASLKAATDSLTTFSEKFGTYPYSNFAVVQTAFLQGGMEYPQLVMISDALAPETYKEAIIHETAHQWWYAVVGNDEVSHPWMDEAMTEFSTSLFYRWNPSYGISFEKRIQDALSGLILYCDMYDKHGESTSMTRRLPEYADNMEYTYMTYVKGEIMLDTLMRTVGEKAFVMGLKNYYSDCAFKNVQPDYLIAAFEKASKRNLKSYFDSWLTGKTELFGKG